MFCGTNFSLSGIALDFIAAFEFRQTFGMIPMTMRKKKGIEQYLPLLYKGLYLCAETTRINKNPDSGLRIRHQITVNPETPYGKTPQYQIVHHDTKRIL
jgi:hypothetical protein